MKQFLKVLEMHYRDLRRKQNIHCILTSYRDDCSLNVDDEDRLSCRAVGERAVTGEVAILVPFVFSPDDDLT
jgi:hypothetical protein